VSAILASRERREIKMVGDMRPLLSDCRVLPPLGTDPEPAGHVLSEAAEGVADPVAQGLERGPAIANLGRVPADELRNAMIDDAKNQHQPSSSV